MDVYWKKEYSILNFNLTTMQIIKNTNPTKTLIVFCCLSNFFYLCRKKSKMKSVLVNIMISAVVVVAVGCRQSKRHAETTNIEAIVCEQSAEADVKNDDYNTSETKIDTIYQDFDRIIREKAARWNVTFEVTELDTAEIRSPAMSEKSVYSIREYKYKFGSRWYEQLYLSIIEMTSDSDAYGFIQKEKKHNEEERPFKITFYSFRISNKIYSFSHVASIHHITIEILKEIYLKYKVTDDNIVHH